MSRVQRIRSVGRKVDVALDVSLRVAGVGRALELEPGFEYMPAPNMGDVVQGLPDQEPLVESAENAGVDRRGHAGQTAERERRNQVRGVGVRVQQRSVYPGGGPGCLVIL